MDTVIVELVRGKDKRLYPIRRRSAAEHHRLATLSHNLRCGRKLSFTLIQETMAAEFGVRRSRGAISKDLRDFTCPLCASGVTPAAEVWRPPTAPPPRSRVRAEVYPWR